MTDLAREFERPLGEREAAELLGVSPNTLKHWRWVGKGPRYVKLVHRVAYRPGDLREWINANVTEPGADTL
jgi:predicted DNA-binding transcriptional regulator AlpA